MSAIRTFIKKHGYFISLLSASLLLSQVFPAGGAILASASDNIGDTLVIRHVAQVPEGRKYVLGTETIENITDLYYYSAAQSPVASAFLKNGYSLTNEQNRLIEADIVENGGKIDLEYTPAVTDVSVTYYKHDNGTETKMGTITDRAYVGEQYTAQPPVYDGADVTATLIGDEKRIVKYGDNKFDVRYSITEPANRNRAQTSSAGAESAPSGYVRGYADNTFRPERDLTRSELYAIMYNLSGGRVPASGVSNEEIVTHLYAKGLIPAIDLSPDAPVTWDEFQESMKALAGPSSVYRIFGFKKGVNVRRGEAVVAINSIFSITDYTDEDNPYSDVYEDNWAYFDILRATGAR